MRRVETVSGHLSGPVVGYSVVEDGIAVLTIDNPPVNSIGSAVAQQLASSLRRAGEDARVKAVVVCGKNCFAAGADIKSMQAGDSKAVLVTEEQLRIAFEACGAKPIVAAITKFALGGGLEVALMCDARVASADAKLGLPELQLGLIPGWGGTQRLPRVIGAAKALDVILTSKALSGAEAHAVGLVDALVAKDEDVLSEALRIVRGTKKNVSLARVDKISADDLFVVEMAEQSVRAKVSDKDVVHPFMALKAVRACIEHRNDPLKGLAAELDGISRCIVHPAHGALVHLFLAQRGRNPFAQGGVVPSRIAIIGAGKMGSGIAASCLLEIANVRVVVKDVSEKALRSCAAYVKSQLDQRLKSASADVRDEVFSRLLVTQNDKDIGDCDMVIEAATEDLQLKKKIFASLIGAVRRDAVLATNTSSIDIDEIGAAIPNDRHRLVGVHFFNPVIVMKIVEVIRTSKTEKQTLANSVALSKALNKVPVVVGNCVGFVGNRVHFPYSALASFLISENLGMDPYSLDDAVVRFGKIPIGPFALADLVGIDVGLHVGAVARRAYPRLYGNTKFVEKLIAEGRTGRIPGKGWYLYPPGSRTPQRDPEIEAHFKTSAAPSVDYQEAVHAMLALVANEGGRVVEEGIVQSESDVDVMTCLGFGWPPYHGGVMYWARNIMGWKRIVTLLRAWKKRFGLEMFEPCKWAVIQAEGK